MSKSGYEGYLIAVDDEGKVLIFAGGQCFARFYRMYLSFLRANGLGKVLIDDPIDIPIRPQAVIDRMTGVNVLVPPQPDDRRIYNDFKKEEDKWM